MKKVLALVLAAVMALSLATVASAAVLNPIDPDGADYATPGDFNYGDDAETFYLENTVDADNGAVVAAKAALAAAKAINTAANAAITASEGITFVDASSAPTDDDNFALALTALNNLLDAGDQIAIGTLLTKDDYADADALAAAVGAIVASIQDVVTDAATLADLEADVADALAATGTFKMSATSVASGAPAFLNTGKYSLSVSVSSDTSDVKASYKLVKNGAKGEDAAGVAIEIKLDPASEKFTVEESKEYKVKIKVVQAVKGGDKITGELEITGDVSNTRAYDTDAYENASGNYILDTEARVIDVSVFEEADGKSLSVNYDDYTVKFAKVAKQNTSLYLYAKTDVVDVDNTKAIGSVGFKPTRVKDAATITMPISHDNQNFYGETVYVYNVVNGKPTGDAIAAEVVNHNSVIFSVPAGTTLGTFAAYGAKEEGDAEKPAIPETGANDIVNIAIVFAVVALAAAGFVAVKKAGK